MFNPYNNRNLHTGHHINPLNAELNPICHLLALLGGATIVVVSRLRVNYMFLSNYILKHSEVIFIMLRHTVNLLIHYVTRGLCDGLIIRSEESYRLWRVAVCDQVTSYASRLKPDRGL